MQMVTSIFIRNILRLLPISVCLIGGLLPPAQAAYKGIDTSLITGERKKLLSQAVSALKSLPKQAREAFIVEELGLSYLPNGQKGVSYNSYLKAYVTPRGALYMDATGKERDWKSSYSQVPLSKWSPAKRLIKQVGQEEVFSSLSGDITRLLHGTVKGILKSMPPDLRDAWLCKEGGLLYNRNGKAALLPECSGKSATNIKFAFRGASDDMLFVNSAGNELSYGDARARNQWSVWEYRILVINMCVDLVGRDEILSDYEKQLNRLRQARREKDTDNSAPSAADDAPSPQKETQAPSQNPPAVTDSPPQPAPMPESAITLDTFNGLPQLSREQYLAEYFNIYYAADDRKNTDPYNRGWKYVEAYGVFMASDGQLHNLKDGHSGTFAWVNKPQGEFYRKMKAYLAEQGDQFLLQNYKKELDDLACRNAEYLLKQLPAALKDGLLADAAGLVYLQNGKSAYPGGLTAYTTRRGRKTEYRSFEDTEAQYVDSRNLDHSWRDLKSYEDTWKYYIAVVQICMDIAGAEQILVRFPDDVKQLRDNYTKVTGNPIPPIPTKTEATLMGS